MTRFTLLAAALAAINPSAVLAGEKEARLYEMRIYYAAPGKLDALNARFRDHTVKLFEKHGMTNIGYWVPIDNKENKLVYVLSFPDKAARDKSFKAFGGDPAWQKAYKASETEGKLVNKIQSIFMTETEYSPKPKPSVGKGEGVFELRTYTTTPKNLGNLNARFRDHTLKLFDKHGMENIAYWNLTKGQKGADNTLIYILGHKSVDAAKASFDTFRNDPAWKEARVASEEKAGGSLTAKDGVKSEFMRATDYSPIR